MSQQLAQVSIMKSFVYKLCFALTVVVVVVVVVVCSCEDDLMDSNESNKTWGVFVPTKEWQEVREGQSIPAGLHVRIDLQTGQKEAKLLEEDENDVVSEDEGLLTLSDTERSTAGQSDRKGVVNKRSKMFSQEQVIEMLRDLNNDRVQGNAPRIAASVSFSDGVTPKKMEYTGKEEDKEMVRSKDHFKRSLKDLQLTFHRDVEVMLELSEVLADNSSGVPELCSALEELEYHVHQIDNARDLNVIGGLVLVVRLLNHTHPEVRGWAAHVIGSASQRCVCMYVCLSVTEVCMYVCMCACLSQRYADMSVYLT